MYPIRLNIETDAYVHSLSHNGKHHLARVRILSQTAENKYIASYCGAFCSAIFNPFVGRYFVDDVYGLRAHDATP